MPVDTPAVKVTALFRRFDTLVAVDHINFVVQTGSITGLLGPNGAGKSTTIKMLTTLLPPTSGQAEVAGYDVATHPAAVRRNIGYVPQLLSADGGLTAWENLLLSARLYGISKRERELRMAESLEFMGLSEARDVLVKTFSGGMIRRLELAQTMLHRPTVLFLDEPTIGLDPIARRVVWERLKMLQHQYAVTIVITTHDMEEADELCDTLIIMHAGRVAAAGAPSELKAAVGDGATLDDVFTHFAGSSIKAGGTYHDIRNTRRTASRLG